MFPHSAQTPALTYLCQFNYIDSIKFNENHLVVERNREWIIKMAPRGTGSKVKTMQFKVQSNSAEDPKCSRVCTMKFRIEFDWKTKNGTELHRLSKIIERELPKVTLTICYIFDKLPI